MLTRLGQIFHGVVTAIRTRPLLFGATAASVVALNVVLPVLALSVARARCDYVTMNPWLRRFPEYLASTTIPLHRKAEFIPNLALFWFSADGPYGVDWGFAVTVADLARFVLMGLLFGAYVALWVHGRDRLALRGWTTRMSRGGVMAVVTSVVGFSTGPCSVMGCGAPVMPVLGLMFTGLSSGTIKLLGHLSGVATAAVFVAVTLAVAWLSMTIGADSSRPDAGASREATR
jgi:hypothetical protein